MLNILPKVGLSISVKIPLQMVVESACILLTLFSHVKNLSVNSWHMSVVVQAVCPLLLLTGLFVWLTSKPKAIMTSWQVRAALV
jgi:hypothetical protein